MDFIRYEKAKEDYDANTRHCLYGLDADLVNYSSLCILLYVFINPKRNGCYFSRLLPELLS